MSIVMHRHAALALLPLTLAACASPLPAPPEVGHPAHADTPAAPAPALTILQTYHDFGKAAGASAPHEGAPSGQEKSDAHQH
jgi:hypothetical protein